MNRMQKLINEIEKTAIEMPKEVYLWCGNGYVLDTMDVTDYLDGRNEISIEEVCMLAIKNNLGLVISREAFEDLVKETIYYDHVSEEEAEEILEEQWCYCDLTMFDDVPTGFEICYLMIDNLRCSDNLEIHS